jgi:hypothetical protein
VARFAALVRVVFLLSLLHSARASPLAPFGPTIRGWPAPVRRASPGANRTYGVRCELPA